MVEAKEHPSGCGLMPAVFKVCVNDFGLARIGDILTVSKV